MSAATASSTKVAHCGMSVQGSSATVTCTTGNSVAAINLVGVVLPAIAGAGGRNPACQDRSCRADRSQLPWRVEAPPGMS